MSLQQSLIDPHYSAPPTQKNSSERDLAHRARVSHTNTDIPTWNEIRALGVDIRIPAEELLDAEGVVIVVDNIPTGISGLHGIENVAYS